MKDAPAFDFYPERWTQGTRAMSKEERSDFLDLLCYQWCDDGLPPDLVSLNRICGCTKRHSVSERVISKFPVSIDGKRRNARLEEIRENQRLRIQKSADRIAKMNAALAKKRHLQGHLVDEQKGILTASSPLTTHHSPKETTSLSPKPPKGAEESDPLLLRIFALYRRRHSTALTPKERKAFAAVQWVEADVLILETAWQKKWRYHRKDILTLFNNWPAEIERATDYLREIKRNGTSNKPNHPGSTFAVFRDAPDREDTSPKTGKLF